MLKERKSGALTREEEFKKMFGEGGAGDATMRQFEDIMKINDKEFKNKNTIALK